MSDATETDETTTPRCRTCGRAGDVLTEDDVRRIVREEIEKYEEWRDHMEWVNRRGESM